MGGTLLSVLMLAGIGLLVGAFVLARRDGMSQKVWLMIAVALVMFGNVAIWVVPMEGGKAPVEVVD